jgi:ADP-heptose:LPS heptosyltransferase
MQNLMRKLWVMAVGRIGIWFDWFAVMTASNAVAEGRICLVRIDAIGDFFIWSRCASQIRTLYREQAIVLIANSLWADVAKELPYWDEVWPLDPKRFGREPIYRFKMLRRMRRAGFATVISPIFSRALLAGDSLVRASGAAQRVGFVGDLTNIFAAEKKISDTWYTDLVPVENGVYSEVERNSLFLKHLSQGAPPDDDKQLPVLAELPEGLRPEGDYFVIFPGGSWVGRQWPVSAFAAAVDAVHAAFGWRVVVCGTAKESFLCEAISAEAGPPLVDLTGRTTLNETVELIRGAKLVIGNETSGVHIAARVGTPSVCILGGGHYGRFLPYPSTVEMRPVPVVHRMPCFNCDWRCTQPHKAGGAVPCVLDVSVDEVLEGVVTALVAGGDKTMRDVITQKLGLGNSRLVAGSWLANLGVACPVSVNLTSHGTGGKR